jgi:hypothetical protein
MKKRKFCSFIYEKANCMSGLYIGLDKYSSLEVGSYPPIGPIGPIGPIIFYGLDFKNKKNYKLKYY